MLHPVVSYQRRRDLLSASLNFRCVLRRRCSWIGSCTRAPGWRRSSSCSVQAFEQVSPSLPHRQSSTAAMAAAAGPGSCFAGFWRCSAPAAGDDPMKSCCSATRRFGIVLSIWKASTEFWASSPSDPPGSENWKEKKLVHQLLFLESFLPSGFAFPVR